VLLEGASEDGRTGRMPAHIPNFQFVITSALTFGSCPMIASQQKKKTKMPYPALYIANLQ
jgi:hypothetical protein